ncbi:MAG: selenocysteine-specific translation elongation factor [Gordonibacter sp.]|uniref:selenocysteine-specific translation elongation factor n=2 Tax=Gordonibacter sp. TaxID=1968902 RepID=UPI002FC749EA
MTGPECAPARRIVLGTAGHIDHGKSSLVQALTGIDPDRLAEEKQRGITIELGFAELELPGGLSVGVVDVPGHERFVRQMIAGATGIDLALLCIAADDGIMPQTIEHLAVLELLGVPSCVVALTKADLVDDEWLAFVSGEIEAFLAESAYAGAPIVPVSSRSGSGLAELSDMLARAAKATRPAKEGTAARLPIDRVFTIKGAGTVVTGTLWSGRVSVGDELEALPSGLRSRVRSVQVHGRDAEAAEAGMRTALNLNALKKSDVRPGDFLVAPGTATATDRFDAWLTYLDAGQGGKPLASGVRVHVAHGTREVTGRVLLMDAQESLAPRQSAYAQIRLDEPLPVSWRDRFVVRSYSPARVVGGGTVLFAHPRRRTNLAPGERELLDALRAHDEAGAVDAALARETHPVSPEQLSRAAGLSTQSAEKRLRELHATGAVAAVGSGKPPFFASRSVLARDLSALENALLRFHLESPLQPGMTKGELAQRCFKRIDPAAFDALLQEAATAGRIAQADGQISHPQAGGGAKRAEEQAAKTLSSLLDAAGAAPPAVADLIAQANVPSAVATRALNTLEKQGLLVRTGQELCFSAEAFATLSAAVVRHLEEHGPSPAADLKEAMGTTRKYAMPVLERLDALGITVREGDLRRLR